MDFLTMLMVFAAFFIVYEAFKHHLIKRALKLVVVCIILFIMLLVANSFVDVGDMFEKESLFSKTGAVIVGRFKESLGDKDAEGFLNTTEVIDKSTGFVEEKFIKK